MYEYTIIPLLESIDTFNTNSNRDGGVVHVSEGDNTEPVTSTDQLVAEIEGLAPCVFDELLIPFRGRPPAKRNLGHDVISVVCIEGE
jgi:hypothetical protein